MRLSHVDRPPLGDVATSIIVTAATNPGGHLHRELWRGTSSIPLSCMLLPWRPRRGSNDSRRSS